MHRWTGYKKKKSKFACFVKYTNSSLKLEGEIWFVLIKAYTNRTWFPSAGRNSPCHSPATLWICSFNHTKTDIMHTISYVQPVAVKLVLWRQWMHEIQVYPVMPENTNFTAPGCVQVPAPPAVLTNKNETWKLKWNIKKRSVIAGLHSKSALIHTSFMLRLTICISKLQLATKSFLKERGAWSITERISTGDLLPTRQMLYRLSYTLRPMVNGVQIRLSQSTLSPSLTPHLQPRLVAQSVQHSPSNWKVPGLNPDRSLGHFFHSVTPHASLSFKHLY